MELTFGGAKKLSMKKWEFFIESPLALDFDLVRAILELKGLLFYCGFCERYRVGFRLPDCKRCPLYWEEAHEELHSAYEDEFSYPCCREYWHWRYWRLEHNEFWARYWAKKVFGRVKNAKEEVRPNSSSFLGKTTILGEVVGMTFSGERYYFIVNNEMAVSLIPESTIKDLIDGDSDDGCNNSS